MAFPSNEVSEAIQTQEIPELLKYHEDRYDGVVVEIQNENENNDAARFASSLKASLSQWTRQEKYGPYKDSGLWKMPTGRVEQGECINKGAVREVKEETGIDTEFLEVVGFRDGHNAAFGKSDLLFVCMLKSLSSEILMEDTEIFAAK
ncbi:hypothetical protein KI387_002454, partial [Taxus chinensis]